MPPNHNQNGFRSRRTGSVVLLAALALSVVLFVFAHDVGYVVFVRAQLQASADATALATARRLGESVPALRQAACTEAGSFVAEGERVQLQPQDVEFGIWDEATRSFVPTDTPSNAVRITTRHKITSDAPSGLYLARLLGRETLPVSTSAVARSTPRDIVLLVDLSGAMNDESEPVALPAMSESAETAMMQDLYYDLGFESFPGQSETIGAPLGIADTPHAYAELTADGGPLTGEQIEPRYRIEAGDSEAERKRKAYGWIIDRQLAALMPNAQPALDSGLHYGYWEKYLDYVIWGGETPRGWLPPSQDADRIDGFCNSGAGASGTKAWRNRLGYATYLNFLLDHGRQSRPDGRHYTPLSRFSPDCPLHSETTPGGTFRFPPRTQPMHTARRALCAALAELEARNAAIANPKQRDWVAVISFDSLTRGGPVVEQPLTSDYQAAMRACALLQASGDKGASRATEAGLSVAEQHLTGPAAAGRPGATKIVVLWSCGAPDLFISDPADVARYRKRHPSPHYDGSAEAADAALVQADRMVRRGYLLDPVAVGRAAERDFLTRLARQAGAPEPFVLMSGPTPPDQTAELRQLLEHLLDAPQVQLVQ